MELIDKAHLMANVRRIHRCYATIENYKLAQDIWPDMNRAEAERLCLDLGLYPYGAKGYTNINKMREHLVMKMKERLAQKKAA
ncbi:MAG: hypothetical protein HRU18_23540 [Pseudoalteromonas sp.]|uniref:hypothetical protein n=1 Tax=Pseudoalteromonas sp. TaxID=53249 RepID=UPI001D5E4F74|nr:hypothetical protein [Pseudoalteromonas sp.]NRA81184.1 hypothetical protein [Pseudoalteromonas sp.]